MSAAVLVTVALAVDSLRRRSRVRRSAVSAGVPTVQKPAPYVGSPRFLWTSIAALGLIGRGRRDAGVLRTAAKLALAVSAAQGLERAAHALTGRRGGADPARRFFSGRTAAAWAAAGVLERTQGRGPGVAAFSAAALAGYPRVAGGRLPISDFVVGAVVGRVVGRLVGQLRVP